MNRRRYTDFDRQRTSARRSASLLDRLRGGPKPLSSTEADRRGGEAVRRFTLLPGLAFTLMLCMGFPDRVAASDRGSLDSKTLAENRDLDQQLLKAHERKDAEMLLALFSRRDDIFFI